MAQPPSWWALGDACWRSVREQPEQSSAALARLLSPAPSGGETLVALGAPTVARERLQRACFDMGAGSLVAQRRQGRALLTRDTVERKRYEAHREQERVAAEAAAEARAKAEQAAAEAAEAAAAKEAAAAARKKPRKSDGSGTKDAAPAKPVKRADPVPRVEVAIQGGEGLASWYHARLVLETKTRSKVRLLNLERHEDGVFTDLPLQIVGRAEEEAVGAEHVRPLQPRNPAWLPTAGEVCEFEYMDGFWPVRVKKAGKEGRWHVVYEEFGADHVATLDKLRERMVWDAQAARFAPAPQG